VSAKHRVFGIRHHGPGSARSLLAALSAFDPDAILVEGPPDAQSLVDIAARDDIEPPVALLVHETANPKHAVFYPFASFSPEWQAIRFGLARGRPVRFMDLPQSHRLAIEPAKPDDAAPIEESDEEDAAVEEGGVSDIATDPLRYLAVLAGYPDGERWWDHVVESRAGGLEVFEAVKDAMAALRQAHPGGSELEARREAWMRQSIRSAAKEGFERIAVVCGAWHAPALVDLGPAAPDAALLKALPKTQTQAAWVPWSYDRLGFASGYGAGVESPAWYDLLWTSPAQPVVAWMTAMARLLREKDLPASSAHVIEAVRLAETLATLRGRALPGLDELLEAASSVVCHGEPAPLRLIERELVYGSRLGHVPSDLPSAPLLADLGREQKRLRMPASAVETDYDLDLRKPNDLDRSRLLHRLALLGVPWGAPQTQGPRSRGTFHERWRLKWNPEFAVALIDASLWGGTVEEASAAFAVHRAMEAGPLGEVAALLGRALLADLPTAIEKLLAVLGSRCAVSRDVLQLMDTYPGLADAWRYGTVRKVDLDVLESMLGELAARISIGLVPACASLDDAAASDMCRRIESVAGAMALREGDQPAWLQAIGSLADMAGLHALVAGRAARMQHDAGLAAPELTARRMGLALSPASGALPAAQWVEGFVGTSATMLVHDDALWALLDGWVAGLAPEAFVETLPLLRRSFAAFPRGERRQLGERARRGTAIPATQVTQAFNVERAKLVVPVIRRIYSGAAP
jgi:hypothetical protein